MNKHVKDINIQEIDTLESKGMLKRFDKTSKIKVKANQNFFTAI